MGEIKSAFEIAMERTKGVAADKESFEAGNFKKEGQKLASHFLNEHDGTLDGISNFSGKELDWVKEGIFESLSANLVLPVDNSILNKNMKVMQGFTKIITGSKDLKALTGQLESFFSEFIDQRQSVQKNLEAQFAPRLRQKEQELSKQMGGNFKLDATKDPEFMKYLKQTYAQLEDQYSRILVQVKEELKKMFRISQQS